MKVVLTGTIVPLRRYLRIIEDQLITVFVRKMSLTLDQVNENAWIL